MDPYCFFVSYAHDDADPHLRKFCDQLAADVRIRVGGDLDSVAFVDRDDLQPGESWPDRLVQALQKTRVFVPFYTVSYFQSDYCGREWAIFDERLKAFAQQSGAAEPPAAVVPVLWVGEDDLPDPLPEVADAIQYTHGDFGGDYAELGARQLMLLRSKEDALQTLINRLGARIVEIARAQELPALPARPIRDEVVSAFAPRVGAPVRPARRPAHLRPQYVQFIYVVGTPDELRPLRSQLGAYGESGGEEWRPYHPDVGTAIAEVAREVAGSENLYSQPVELGADLMARLEQARAERQLVAIIVDTWTLQVERYRELMGPYDLGNFENCIVLVPWNPSDPETLSAQDELERMVTATFPRLTLKKDPDSFIDEIRSAEDLRKSLAVGLATARGRVVQVAEAQQIAGGARLSKPVISSRPDG